MPDRVKYTKKCLGPQCRRPVWRYKLCRIHHREYMQMRSILEAVAPPNPIPPVASKARVIQ